MTSSLHVSLPDELRAFVDLRTNGTSDFATPSEYVRALIREDMKHQANRKYVLKTLLRSMDDIEHGRLYTADEIKLRAKAYLNRRVAEMERGDK